eukprot:m.40349 g.40349  ORF g.40349 m.40349 type:complete len:84 (-) comp11704_c0_seq1:360-611(-)
MDGPVEQDGRPKEDHNRREQRAMPSDEEPTMVTGVMDSLHLGYLNPNCRCVFTSPISHLPSSSPSAISISSSIACITIAVTVA